MSDDSLAALNRFSFDPADQTLQRRERSALWTSTWVRGCVILVMLPTTWIVGTQTFDQIMTSILLFCYAIVLVVSGVLLRRGQGMAFVGFAGAFFDVMLIASLPLIWYITLGGDANPSSLLLKSSITVFSLLLIAMNTLAMRPLYPALVTLGALIVQAVLIAFALADDRTVFTPSFLEAYTTAAVATGSLVTNPLVLAIAGAMLTLVTVRARRMVIEAVQLENTNVQLGRYFSPNLVRRLSERTDLFSIGGERRELSFVFTDLTGFTQFVETNPPDVVVPILNGYLHKLVEVVYQHDGTIDKVVGDAVHIIFGAPLLQSDHA
ncbi:MAG: adenylate/guanylate cyclase domain-containing protein, partial [Pseudomonadota bacterium]